MLVTKFVNFFKFSAICLLTFASSLLAGEQAYISVESGGQLGNQMFHFSAALAYAWDHHLEPRFPVLNESQNNLSYNRDRIFFRLNPTQSPIALTTYSVFHPNYEKLPDDLKNVNLTGGLFSWKYFDHRRHEILDTYAPSQDVVSKLHQKYGDLIAQNNTVAVHVRTYSKEIHDEGLHFVGMQYFAEILNAFPTDSLFVVFSDRINWSKAHFSNQFPDKQFFFVEGNDHIEDLFLMSMMKHQILSKSTFSWWAAYLNTNPDKIVYAPVKRNLPLPDWIKTTAKIVLGWFGKYYWSNEDYYLPDWKIVYYELEPYPEDIYNYGDKSTSVDAREK